MIKRVKLKYEPVAKRKTKDIAFVVSPEHVAAVNRSIEKKSNEISKKKESKKIGLLQYMWQAYFLQKNKKNTKK